MQFKLAVLGLLILSAGLLAYSAMPTIHRNQIVTSQEIIGEAFPLTGGESRVLSKDLNATAAQTVSLRFNMTVTNTSGAPALAELRIFLRNSTSCVGNSPATYLVRKSTSNDTLSVPIVRTGTYCFIFDNESDTAAKVVSAQAQLELRSEQISVSRNGSASMAGLGIGAFGFLVLIYGATRKTVIPWE